MREERGWFFVHLKVCMADARFYRWMSRSIRLNLTQQSKGSLRLERIACGTKGNGTGATEGAE